MVIMRQGWSMSLFQASQQYYVLQGFLQPTETRVRVSTQLIDAENGAQRWPETFDEDGADLLRGRALGLRRWRAAR